MADPLTVSGGGSVAVSTGEIGEHATALRRFISAAGMCRQRLDSIDTLIRESAIVEHDAPVSAVRAEEAIRDSAEALWRAELLARSISVKLEAAAFGYGVAERFAENLAQSAAATLAYRLGTLWPVLGVALMPGATVMLGSIMFMPRDERAALLGWFTHRSGVLSDPRFVDAVRLAAESADDAGMGLLRVPPQLHALLGSEGLGILGVGTSAAVVTGAARSVGALRETPVQVEARKTITTSVPKSFADHASRVPTGEEQITVERYVIPGEADRFVVYIGGTRDGGLESTTEPFDMTSNLSAVGMGDSGSLRSVELALADAGVTAESPITFVGYSQGATTATVHADSGNYNTVGLLTLGSPAMDLQRSDAVHVALEHDEDVVTATTGFHKSNDTIVASRAVFDGGDVPHGVLPAHDIGLYIETAALVDASHEARLTKAEEVFAGFSRGATRVESTDYRATRIHAGRTSS
ncbi:hypothetical protein [Homoserinimonas hongtaonis]|uniref:hypothetical protein n=1 Tax=Homoserinimonas hongtaonis TaxID=2079791 RepID=UPI000D356C80|nr:hypothetical protein [Salinibacterium hongtaonis]AWB90419.1 hypothetical protein C2138_13415 [Salinibacterium hongtaonis]